MPDTGPEAVLAEIAGRLARLGRPFALVGGLAEITRRGFHRDQDLLAKLAVVLEDAASH